AMLTGVSLVVCGVVALGLGAVAGCKRGKMTKEEYMLRRTEVGRSDVGIAAASPVQVTVVRFSPETDGTIGVFLKLSNADAKRLTWAKVDCTISDVAGQEIGSTQGEPVPSGGLGKGESCEFHWFVRVKDVGAALTASASVAEMKTE
ncbi:MAG: hypothetical protein NT031_14185, partial [Planctomycetota bacterium]|nr:hypothetical protein [Planctomycetota bacterium]